MKQIFKKAGMLPGGSYYNILKKVIQILLKDGQIELIDYNELVNNLDVADSMLAAYLRIKQ